MPQPPVPYAPPGYGPPPGYPGAYPYFPPPRTATFSNLLGAMFHVWSKNFRYFFEVYFVLSLATGAIGISIGYALGFLVTPGGFPGTVPGNINSANLGLFLLYIVLALVASLILGSIVLGGMTEFAVRHHRNEPTTIKQALRRGLDRFVSILGAQILVGLLIGGLILVPIVALVAVVIVAGSSPVGALALICGLAVALLFAGVIALIIYVGTALYAPVIMIENARAVDGIMRSWRMTKGHRWSLFGAILVTAILGAVISSVNFGAAFLPAGPVSVVVSLVISALVSGTTGSWLVILFAVGYDLIHRQPTFVAPPYYPGAPMGPPPTAAQAPPQPPPAPPRGP